MNFLTNFLAFFAGSFVVVAVVFILGLGPILLAIHFGIKPLPYGAPALVAIWCAIAALAYAIIRDRAP